MKRNLIAWALPGGLIEFGYVLPEGALPIVAGKPATVRHVIDVMARHGRDEREQLLVPGIPEAGTQEEAFNAMVRFCREVRRRVSYPNRTRARG
ncbi:host nuclease inhibitor protein [Escherichia coli]|uniref:host nuclease inhibitor protein n=1 Tax=Escherichia coli TaxID=562 RepID=UPI000C7E73A8|nr:host nuclease inhibitor protein [Escherichia coli]AUM07872.1 host nuclease inhibitor protein [Escherichia coli]